MYVCVCVRERERERERDSTEHQANSTQFGLISFENLLRPPTKTNPKYTDDEQQKNFAESEKQTNKTWFLEEIFHQLYNPLRKGYNDFINHMFKIHWIVSWCCNQHSLPQ